MQPFPPHFFDPNRRTGRRTATCSTETAQLFFGDSCPAAPFLLFPRRGVELVPVRTQDSSPSAASGRHCATRSLQGIVLRRVFIRYRGAQFSARGPFFVTSSSRFGALGNFIQTYTRAAISLGSARTREKQNVHPGTHQTRADWILCSFCGIPHVNPTPPLAPPDRLPNFIAE